MNIERRFRFAVENGEFSGMLENKVLFRGKTTLENGEYTGVIQIMPGQFRFQITDCERDENTLFQMVLTPNIVAHLFSIGVM